MVYISLSPNFNFLDLFDILAYNEYPWELSHFCCYILGCPVVLLCTMVMKEGLSHVNGSEEHMMKILAL